MIFEELLNQYLDGTLGDIDQTEFFHIMSVSPEKRAEFNEYVSMRTAMVKDRISQVVPQGLEQSVLAAAAPAGVSSGAAAIGAKGVGAVTGTTALMTKLAMVLLVAGGMTAGGVMGYVMGTKNQGVNISNNAPITATVQGEASQSQVSAPEQKEQAIPKKASHVATTSASRQLLRASAPVDMVIGAQSLSAPEANVISAPLGNASQNTIEKLLMTANVPVTHTVAIMVTPQREDHSSGVMLQESKMPIDNEWQPSNADEPGQYQLELQEGGGILLPNLSSSNLSATPFINNTALHFGMKIWDGGMLGIGAGQSTYALQYTSQPDQLTTITYMQYSNVWYTGLYYQQSLASFIGLTPRATLELAGTNIGALGNLQMGVSYPITRNVYAGISGVASDMLYRHGGAWLSSQKIGFMFGIGTEF